MNAFTALASHWVLALLLLLLALGLVLLGMIRIVASSMHPTHPEERALRNRGEEVAEEAQPGQEPKTEANGGSLLTAAAGLTPESPESFRLLLEEAEETRDLSDASPSRSPLRLFTQAMAWIRERVAADLPARELRDTFAAAFQYLSNRMPGRADQIPLYLLVGPPQAGKSTLLTQSRLPWRWRQNQRTFGSSSGIQWAFCEQGVVLELPGGASSGKNDAAATWEKVPSLLLRHRPRRPLDGLILVLPADGLLAGSTREESFPQNVRTGLRRELQRISRTLAMRLPLYVIVSKCDRISGFTCLVNELPAHKRQDCLGWSHPHPATAGVDAAQIEKACHSLRQMFLRLAAEAAMEHDLRLQTTEEAAWKAWSDLDLQLPILLDALHLELTALLAATDEAPLLLRGIYLAGDIGEASTTVADPALTPAAPGHSPRPPARRLGFVETLLLQRVFPERGLAAPAGATLTLRQPRALVMQLTAAALLLGLGFGTALQCRRLTAWRDQRVVPMLQTLESRRPTPPAQWLQAMVRGGAQPLRSWLLPASLVSGVNSAFERRLQHGLEARVYPALARTLQQQARRQAQHWVAVAANPPASEPAQRIARPDQLAEFAILQKFAHDWLQLQDAIDAYQGLAYADHTPSLAEVQRFLTRLGAPPQQPLTASSPVYRALLAAHGPAFVYAPEEQNQAGQVMRELVRRLLYRWYLDNALMSDLQQLNRLPQSASADRSRLSVRIRKDLADPVLASVLQDDQRLRGPLYSVTLGIVHRSGYVNATMRAFIQNEANGDALQARALAEQLRTPAGSALIALKDGHWQLTAPPR